MRNKKVLMACTNYWTSPFHVSSHHMAKGFLQNGFEVAFISEPVSPFHFARPSTSNLGSRLKLCQGGGELQCDGNLWAYVPFTLLPPHDKPLMRHSWVYSNWHHLTIPSIVKTARRRGFGKVDLLYVDSPVQGFWLDNIEYDHSIFHMADNSSGFLTSSPEREEQERKIVSSVDLTVYSARSLAARVEGMSPKRMLLFPNGVDFMHFNRESEEEPEEYRDLPRPIVVYVGAMDYWFDFDLVNEAARSMPDVTFFLIGPAGMAERRLDRISNLHLAGSREFDEIPAYLRHADLGIIPFNVREYPDLVHSIHPLKLYEYFASGLNVVSSRWDELEAIDSLAYLADSRDQFLDQIRTALSVDDNCRNLRNYAARQDWSIRMEQLLSDPGLKDYSE